MAFGVAPALAIGGTVFGGATSAMGARQQNRAIQRTMQAQQRATATQQQQLSDAASLELLRNRRRADQIEGRLRVAAGEAGVGMGGSYGALLRQNDYDESLNESVIQRNFQNQLAAVRSGFEADTARLAAGVTSPILAAFTGGLQGLSTGLSIGGAVDEFGRLRNTPEPEPFEPVTPPSLL